MVVSSSSRISMTACSRAASLSGSSTPVASLTRCSPRAQSKRYSGTAFHTPKGVQCPQTLTVPAVIGEAPADPAGLVLTLSSKKARHDETGRRVGMVLRKDHDQGNDCCRESL